MAAGAASPPVLKVRALYCPNCGAVVELRGFGHALTAVCGSCLTVLDATTPSLQILQKMDEALRRTPLLPLGSRGKLRGTLWEVIGFQTRGAEDWEWAEYVLFNPYKGFRYLTEYRGHWNYVTTVRALPVVFGNMAWLGGHKFKRFSTAEVSTKFVLGEFPWRVKVEETVTAMDFIDPPLMLSAETTAEEVNWSQGEYTPGAEIWQAFGQSGAAPSPHGVFANQPSPFAGKVGGIWTTWLLMLAGLVALALAVSSFTAQKELFHQKYSFSPGARGEASFVTPIFELKGRTATLEVEVKTNLLDDWCYFNFALINTDTGEAFDFGREMKYYYDSDGADGSKNDSVLIPSVPAGRYYLRVEPEMDTTSSGSRSRGIGYELILRHDVPSYAYFWIAGLLLLLPPIFYSMRAKSFETARWAESGDSTVASSDSDSDEE